MGPTLKKVFGSITVAGVLSAIAAYALPNVNTGALGPTWGPIAAALIGVVLGVVVHHNNPTGSS